MDWFDQSSADQFFAVDDEGDFAARQYCAPGNRGVPSHLLGDGPCHQLTPTDHFVDQQSQLSIGRANGDHELRGVRLSRAIERFRQIHDWHRTILEYRNRLTRSCGNRHFVDFEGSIDTIELQRVGIAGRSDDERRQDRERQRHAQFGCRARAEL